MTPERRRRRAERPAGPATPVLAARSAFEEFRVVELTPPMPLSLAAAIYAGVGAACEREGYEAYCKVEHGLGVIWARRPR